MSAIKLIRPSIIAVLLLILISGYALFVEPLIGLADNGDFYRVMISNDIKHELGRSEDDFFAYFNHEYDKVKYYNELEGKNKSTQDIFIKIAVKIDDVFTRDEKFDIRFYAFLCLIVLAFALYWLIEAAQTMAHNKANQYFIALTALMIFGDIGYTCYFNSFFGEAIGYSFYLLSIAALLKFITTKDYKLKYIIIFSLSTLMFMGAKNQYALNGILAFLVLLFILLFKTKKSKKVIVMVLASLLLMGSFYFM